MLLKKMHLQTKCIDINFFIIDIHKINLNTTEVVTKTMFITTENCNMKTSSMQIVSNFTIEDK